MTNRELGEMTKDIAAPMIDIQTYDPEGFERWKWAVMNRISRAIGGTDEQREERDF